MWRTKGSRSTHCKVGRGNRHTQYCRASSGGQISKVGRDPERERAQKKEEMRLRECVRVLHAARGRHKRGSEMGDAETMRCRYDTMRY